MNSDKKNEIIAAFPPPAKKSTADYSTWDGCFWNTVKRVLVGNPAAEAKAVTADINKILSALQSSYKVLPRNPLDPTAPVSDETEINMWVINTISNLSSQKVVTPMQEDLLKSGLIDVVTRLFPIPDQISFYVTFQDNLRNALLKLPSPQAPPPIPTQEEDSDEENAKEGSENSKDTSKQTVQASNGLLNMVAEQLSPENIHKIAKQLRKTNSKNSVAQAITETDYSSDLSEFTNELQTTMTNKVESIVNEAISNVFVSLSKQGAQGQMISSAYDFQLVNRISNYTSTLLRQLDEHYDKDVPENGNESIKAAQSITKASAFYANFAADLDAVHEAFGRSTQNENSKSGRNANEISTYVEGNQSASAQPAWRKNLDQVARAIYGDNSSVESLIHTSEYDAVQLAANAAGFGSKLSEEFVEDRSNAEKALNSLLANTKQIFNDTQQSFQDLANDYFGALSEYTDSRESYQIDEAVNEAYTSALSGLTGIVATGQVQYASNSVSSMQSTANSKPSN